MSSATDRHSVPVVTDAVDVILRDGSTLRLRAPASADADALVAFFAGLSEHSRYRRFHGLVRADPALVAAFLDPDWVERGALIATVAGDGHERIVALGDFARLRDPEAAEAAFAVSDDFQGRGVGTRLLEQLAGRAAAAGIERFVATVLAQNHAMLGVFTGAGFEVARELDGGEVEVRFPIAATETFRCERTGPGKSP